MSECDFSKSKWNWWNHLNCVVGQECAFELLVSWTLPEITGEGERSKWNFFRKSEVLNEMMFGRQHLICSLCKMWNHNENNQVFFVHLKCVFYRLKQPTHTRKKNQRKIDHWPKCINALHQNAHEIPRWTRCNTKNRSNECVFAALFAYLFVPVSAYHIIDRLA